MTAMRTAATADLVRTARCLTTAAAPSQPAPSRSYTALLMETSSTFADVPETAVEAAREARDRWVREIVAWHFDPQTGCPFWLEYASRLDCDPPQPIRG